MDKNNIEQLKALSKIFNTEKVVSQSDVEAVLKGILGLLNNFKKGNETLNSDTKKVVDQALNYLETEHEKMKKDVSQETTKTTKAIESKLATSLKEVNAIMKEILAMKPQDGKDADEDKIVDDVLAKIVLPEYKETVLDGRKEIVEKINKGNKKDPKIEFTQIGGTEKMEAGILDRAVSILDQRTQFLINKTIKVDGTTITGNGTDSSPLVATGGGGTWGSITGTLSSQTDLQSALDLKAPLISPTFATSIGTSYLTASEILITNASKGIISAPVATYPSLTELAFVKGVTSSIQTQLGTYLPLAGGTMTGGITNSTSVNPLTTLAESWIGPSSTTGVYFKGGNVGIGTTAPLNKFVVSAAGVQGIEFAPGATSYILAYNRSTSAYSPIELTGTTLNLQPSGAGTGLFLNTTGNVGIGTTLPTNILSLGGNSARTFWMERHTTANTAGNSLSVKSGGSTSASTDKNGGDLLLQSGISTGTGFSSIKLQAVTAGVTGTTDRTVTTHFEVGNSKIAFFGVTPVVKATVLTTQLTSITHTAPGTPDYAIQNFTQTTPFGFVTADEANTVLSVIMNLQARVAELETKLTAYGLLT